VWGAKRLGLDPAAFRQYDGVMKEALKKGVLMGCASLVIKDGRVVHRAEYGWADAQTRTPFTVGTICRLYCTTKTFVSVAAMILFEEGKLAIDDELSKYLPAFRHVQVQEATAGDAGGGVVLAEPRPPKRPITLRHLLTHTAGFGYQQDFAREPEAPGQHRYVDLVHAVETRQVRSLAEWAERFARIPLICEPGTRYEYSHAADVLGRVVEVVSGKPLDVFFRDRIFGPLDMGDTGFSVPDSKLHRLGAMYGHSETRQILLKAGKEKRDPLFDGRGCKRKLCRIDGSTAAESAWAERNLNPVLSGGGSIGFNSGGCVSTVRDMERFMRFLLGRGALGGARLLRAETVEMMISNWVPGVLLASGSITRSEADALEAGPPADAGAPAATGEKGSGVGKPPDEDPADRDRFSPWCVVGQMFWNPYAGGRGGSERTLDVGQGGAAATSWTVNFQENLAILWFSQLVDDLGWDKLSSPLNDIWAVVRQAYEGAHCAGGAAPEAGHAVSERQGRAAKRRPAAAVIR